MGFPWFIVVVIGPILLGLVLAYAMWRNKVETRPGDERRSDEAAKRLRDQLNAEDTAREHEDQHEQDRRNRPDIYEA